MLPYDVCCLWRLLFMTLSPPVVRWNKKFNFYKSLENIILWCLSHYDVYRIMTFVVYDVCRIMMFVALWCLLHYDVCRIMTFVVYDLCRIMMFVAYWVCHLMTFVALWRLSPYDVCSLGGLMACRLWRLLLCQKLKLICSKIVCLRSQRLCGQVLK